VKTESGNAGEGEVKGFGLVCFSTVKETTLVLTTMSGYVIGGKKLYVNISASRGEDIAAFSN